MPWWAWIIVGFGGAAVFFGGLVIAWLIAFGKSMQW